MSSTQDFGRSVEESAILDDRFVLDRRLGEDGIGEVWQATDLQLQRTVVIRWLHPHLRDDHTVVERFRMEALAAAGLSHGHVASLFDVAVSDALAYTVGEYVDGPSLARLMDDGPLEPPVVAAIGYQAAMGLAEAHDAGIIHRDIHPGNLIVGRDGRVRLVDFGAALIVEPDRVPTHPGERDTDLYLAPEQVESEVLGTDRSDVYALGRTLLDALDGGTEHPRNGGGLLDRVMEALPGLPLGSSAGDLLRDHLAAATDPEPAARPSALELGDALRELSDRRQDEVLRALVGRLPSTEFGRRPARR